MLRWRWWRGEDRGRGGVAGRWRSTIALGHLVLLRLWSEAPLGEKWDGGRLRVLKSCEANLHE